MRSRTLGEPSEYVIWAASGLLAVLLGLGGAFVLWYVLHRASNASLIDAAICAFGAGLTLLGLATGKQMARVFLVLMAVALVLGFLLGSPAFSHLAA
jgi:hypothetical protein